MPDDRFGDLGQPASADGSDDAGRTRPAAERLAELDASELHRRPPRPPDRRSFSTRYTWVLGVIVAIVIILVGISTLPHAGAGLHGPPAGRQAPRFAAVTALGPTDGTPNVKQSSSDTVHSNKTPACDVRGAGVITSCGLVRRPLVITFVGPGTSRCNGYLDRVERLAPMFPQVAFAAVVSGRPKREVAALVRRHGWTFPVAVDSDHVLFDLYSVAVCATTTFVYRGGVVRADRILAQDLSDAQLEAAIRATAAGPPGGAR